MRLLTPAGWQLLGGGLVLYAAGVVGGWPELVGLGAAALVVLAVAGLLVVLRPRLSLDRVVLPDRVTGGTPALARLDVVSRSRLPTVAVTVVDQVDGKPVDVAVPALLPGGRRTLRYPLPTPRRGRVALGPMRAERRDPLGLLRRAQSLGGGAVLWVHPRTHVLPVLPVGNQLDQEGPLLETSPRGTVTFSTLREYVRGDDPRLVHWRSTARTGQLMVRENVDTSQPTTTVVVDTRCTPALLDEVCELAASVVLAVQRAGRPITLHAGGEDVAAVRALGARDLADRLAALAPLDGEDPRLLVALTERAEPGGALVVVTAREDPLAMSRLAELRSRASSVVLVRLGDTGPARAERTAGVVVVRGTDAAAAAAAWRAMLGVRG